jgi:hypothetical protein
MPEASFFGVNMLDKLHRLVQNVNIVYTLSRNITSRIAKISKTVDGIEIFKCDDMVIVCSVEKCLIVHKGKQVTIDYKGIEATDNEVINEVSEKISECDEVVKFVDEVLPKSEEALKTLKALKTLLDMLEK